jgi:hypothetical protein
MVLVPPLALRKYRNGGLSTSRYRPARLDLHESGIPLDSLEKDINLLLVLIMGCRCSNRNRAPKILERHQLFFGLRLVSKEFKHPAIQTKIGQHFGGFFHQIKVRHPIERQDSMKTVI